MNRDCTLDDLLLLRSELRLVCEKPRSGGAQWGTNLVTLQLGKDGLLEFSDELTDQQVVVSVEELLQALDNEIDSSVSAMMH